MHEDLTADQRADAVAARQYGAISNAQARAEGLTRHQVRQRRRCGRWRRAGHGVSVVAAVPASDEQRAAVAILSGPAGTVASHLTALALYGVCGFPARPHVTVPRGSSGRMGNTHVHFSSLGPEDVSTAAGLPATAPARSLVDAAALVGYDRLCDLVDTALFLRLATPDDVRAAMARASRRPGRTGLQRLSASLEVWTPGPHPGSPAEMRLLRRIQAWGFPLPQRQMVVRDGAGRWVARVDAGIPDYKAVLEYQSKEFHGPRRKPLDEERRTQVEALGWTVVWVESADLRLGATRLRNVLAALAKSRSAA
jgi:hypothetical protein